MSFQVSPGVSVREIDATNVIPAVSTSIGAFAGPFRWGPGGQAVTVSSEKELASNFGAPNGEDGDLDRSFLTAASFLRYSNFLRVSRAIADDALNSSSGLTSARIINKEVFDGIQNPPVGFHARYPGKIGDSIGVQIVAFSDENEDTYGFDYVPGTTEFGENEEAVNDEIHIRIIDVDGEITGTEGTVLETYQGLSLLPNAQLSDGRANYYVDVINERSGFVYVTNLVNVSGGYFTFDGTTFNVTGAGQIRPASANVTSEITTVSSINVGGVDIEGDTTVSQFVAAFQAGTRYTAEPLAGNNVKVDLFLNPDSDSQAFGELILTPNQIISITTDESTEDFNGVNISVFTSDSVSEINEVNGDYVITFIPGTSTLGDIVDLIDSVEGISATISEGLATDLVEFGYSEFVGGVAELEFVYDSDIVTLEIQDLSSPGFAAVAFYYDESFGDSPETSVTIDKSTDVLSITYGPQHTLDDIVTAVDGDSDFDAIVSGDGDNLVPAGIDTDLEGGNVEEIVSIDSINYTNLDRLDDGFVTVSITLTSDATLNDIATALAAPNADPNITSASEIVQIAVDGILVSEMGSSTEELLRKNSSINFGTANYIALVLSGAGQFADDNLIEIQLQNGSDGDTSNAAAIITAIDEVFGDAELIDISLIFAHKLYGATAEVVDQAINTLTQTRRDCVGFISTPLEVATLSGDNNKKDATIEYLSEFNSSYLVLDAGVRYVYNRYTDRYVWVPGSASVAGLCARTDSIADPWFSPAGFNRGVILDTVKLGYNPKQADRDDLYKIGINSIVTFPGLGTVLYGDKTAQKKPSAFDRINVRRLFIVIQKAISTAAKFQLFELNDEFTRAMFRNMVEPFLRDVKGRRGVTDFLVVCDATNNTGEVIDSNRFVGDIYIKPARSINFIQLNTIATRTGVEFSELIVRNN
jgi:hypothetical protein